MSAAVPSAAVAASLRYLAELELVPGALVTVLDGHPATLSWLGAVAGHRTVPLGVEHFGQTGTVADLYRHFGIDAQGIVLAGQTTAAGKPIRHLHTISGR